MGCGTRTRTRTRSFFLLCLFLFSSLLSQNLLVLAEKKSYVVYLGAHSHGPQEISLQSTEERVKDSHYDFLASFLGSKEKAKESIFYSYTNYINGFAAILDEEEAKSISQHPDVISVFGNRGRKLHTTRSWDFMGLERHGKVLPNSIWSRANFGKNVIIGNLDTGVWPESASLRDEGMGAVPSEWRGSCENENDSSFECNRKLIGGKFFNKGYRAFLATNNATNVRVVDSPRDTEGHGSHTLSTAAGRFVPSASVFGNGNGTAKGGSPNAHVAAYKVCWPPVDGGGECFDADILAAFDTAIHDGVHVLSVSLGGPPGDYFDDGIAIGSFHAIKHGITVACSAGNSGPDAGSVSNVAPWILTVGASTIDREFQSYVFLHNSKLLFKGQSLAASKLPKKYFQLISSVDAKADGAADLDAVQCVKNSLNPAKVKGKIVVCTRGNNARVEKGEVVREAGGIGMVLANDNSTGNEMIADAHVLPATHISYTDGLALLNYINSTRSALGYIRAPETKVGTKPAPVMAAFSSQGPNTVNEEILKPDITAPGVSIIAAYTKASSPTDLDFDKRRIPFNAESGTSMSCPHVAGIAGLLKAMHPGWSPSAIRSAIMTTAISRDNRRMPMSDSNFERATPFGYGSGHVHPNRAMDPGLIYDLSANDYLNFLCALGYNSSQIATFSHPYKCPQTPIKIENLNYPSISVPNLSASAGKLEITRRVKNVGCIATYTVRVHQPRGFSVSVEPKMLNFSGLGEVKEYKLILEAKKGAVKGQYAFGSLVWSDGKHRVRSPIAVKA